MGNCSGYYYPEFVKEVKAKIEAGKGESAKCIKENFKVRYEAERDKIALFAASLHHIDDKRVQASAYIEDLEIENAELRE